MSQQKNITSQSMHDISKINQLNDDITESRARVLSMMYNKQKEGTKDSKRRNIQIEDLQMRINKLTLMQHDEILRVYSHVRLTRNISPPPPLSNSKRLPVKPNTPQPSAPSSISRPATPTPSPLPLSPTLSKSVTSSRPISPTSSLKIIKIDNGHDSIGINMGPTSFQLDNENDEEEDNDIIYPEGVTDLYPYQVIARFRKLLGKSTNFRLEPLIVGENSTETLVLGLDNFAQQHDCHLIFTNNDQCFDNSIYRASEGVADLGSIHLLVTDSLPTANFDFTINLDYDNDIIQSKENIEKFVFDFCKAISQVLSCENSNVRVFSINRLAEQSGKSQVNFGLTTPEPKRTEQLAHDLQIYARAGFATDSILRHVIPGEYECIWKPVLTYLQIQPSDLDSRYNRDYTEPGLSNEETRGGYPYYLPIGWYRHALNVLDKYEGSQTWLGCINAEGEWPVAFHGTHSGAVTGIVQEGLSPNAAKTDAMIDEAIEQMGEEANRPGLYVATHCDGGSYPRYTTPFTVTTFPDKSETFSLVFQCRVEPNKFTTHKTPVDEGEAWRIVDPNGIRPYGILLKKEA